MKVFSSIGRFILFAVVNSLSLNKVLTKNLFRNISLISYFFTDDGKNHEKQCLLYIPVPTVN